MTNARAVKIESRDDPDFALDLVTDCVDRIQVEADLQLTSEDGRIDESFSAVPFNEGEEGKLSAWVRLKTSELQGAYVRQVPGGQLTSVYQSLIRAAAPRARRAEGPARPPPWTTRDSDR